MKNQRAIRAAQRQKRKQMVSLGLIGSGVLVLLTFAFLLLGGNRPSSQASPNVSVDVQGSANLKVDKEKVDLGDVQLGETVQVEFTLSNAGDQPLKFSEEPYIEVVEGC